VAVSTLGQVSAAVLLLTCGLAIAADPRPADAERRRSFVPDGWKIGECPPAYGPHVVLCAATDTGPFKVDRHIPTASVDAPPGSCVEVEKALLARWEGKMSVARRLGGRCGPSGDPCNEIHLQDPRPVDPVGLLVYVICPTRGPVEVVQYAVSAKVVDRFEGVARGLVRWTSR
jgi:hypothetical protein